MKKPYSYLTKFFSIILISIFIIIFVTENTDFINKNYKNSIISTLEKNTNLKVQIRKVEIKWHGLNPNILFDQIILSEEDTNKIIIKGDKLIASLNLYESILNRRITPREFNLVKTDLKIRYKGGELFFKDKNILDLKDFFVSGDNEESDVDFSKLKFRITNSSITLEGAPSLLEYKFKRINLVLKSNNNNLKIFSTFNHVNDDEFVHIAADLYLSKNKKPNGTIYSKGINLNLEKFPLQPKNINILANKMDYTFWSKLENGKLVTVNGKIKANNFVLKNKRTDEKIILANMNSNVDYFIKDQSRKFLLSELYFKIKKHTYKNNQFFWKVKRNGGIDLSLNHIRIIDLKNFIKLFPNILDRKLSEKFDYVKTGEINQVKILDLHKLKLLRFSFLFRDVEILKKEKFFSINGLSGHSQGNYNRGFFNVDNSNISIHHKKFNTEKVPLAFKALVNYQVKKNNLYVKTKNLIIDDKHKLDVNASLNRGKLDFRITTSGKTESLEDTLQKYKIKTISNDSLLVSGKYNIDIRAKDYNKKKNLYGIIQLSNLVLHDKERNLSITDLSTRINFNGAHIISKKTKFYFDKNHFDFLVNTDILNNSKKYYLQANGKINTKLIKNMFEIKNEKIFQGSTFARVNIYFDPDNLTEKINFNLISELKGVSIDIFGPLRKSANEKKLFNMTYEYDKNKKNKIRVFFDKYKMLVSLKNNTWLLNIDSPYIKGKVNWPLENSEKSRVMANLIFLDMNKFSYPSEIGKLPYLDLKSKQIRIASLYLDNVDILTKPAEDSLIFEKFIFKNIHLSMDAKGKWTKTNKKEETFFNANFKSDNLGKALKGLGYGGLIKKGKFDSQFEGVWIGSPEDFKFSICNGTLKLNSKNGEVLQVTKQTQAIGQLLGLFSISSIPKRLSLDFSDFFSSGLNYDDMEGQLAFKSGKADTEKLILKGSFGEMRLSGETDLVAETYDQTLLFIPDLSSTTLITGTVLGGPIGAVAAIFYDKFLKEIGIDTNKLAGIEYSVKGPWRDPEVKVTESFKPLLN